MRYIIYILMLLMLIGCGHRRGMAPVEELIWRPLNKFQRTHVVKRGDTLYSVAFRYDKDFRELAAANHLYSPYKIRVGQVINLQVPQRRPAVQNHYVWKQASPATPRRQLMAKREPTASKTVWIRNPFRQSTWRWPVNGRVTNHFVPQQGKKGIDIAGKKGDLVKASADGVIAYAGSGLSGYGNLIIIKHDGQFLTAYGNNFRNRVKEGQRVKAGQVIADMGVIDRRYWGVHFEIRKAGQPVDPMGYLRG